MRARVLVIASIACVAALTGFAAQAHPANGISMSGVVLNAVSRAPLSGVRIVVFEGLLGQQLPKDESGARVLITDERGSYVLTNLPSDHVTLVLSKAGYQSLRYDLELQGRGGAFAADPILMWPLAKTAWLPCGSLMQPGVTADVYVVCAGSY